MKKWLHENYLHFLIIGIFLALCLVYFSPAIQGKVLYQSDVLEAKAMAKEIMDVRAATGKGPLWTNSMYGGMPSFQIWVKFPGNLITYVIDLLNTVFPNPINVVLCYLMGAYFLLNVIRLKPWPAAAGAIAFAFTSYNFIYIEAGHSNQAWAIALFAPVLAAILLTLRGKHLLGFVLTAFFLAFEIRCNHIQMTYYLFMAIMILMVFELYHALISGQIKPFLTAVGYLLAGAVLALGINAGTLWTTYEFGQESIRGKANLTRSTSNSESGLGKEYAYHWSQGVGEISTFLVPNMYGGASTSKLLTEDSEIAKLLRKGGLPENQITGTITELQQSGTFSTYWGDKSSTHGPWYFGAIVGFLFVLGLLIIDNRYKWWIASTTFLFIFLSFGKNFPLISDLFFDYLPMYNKFRAVESTLVIPALLIPLLGFMAVKELIDQVEKRKELPKKLLLAFYITAGLLIVFMMFPTLFFNFKNQYHSVVIQSFAQRFDKNMELANAMGNALISDRIALARADAFRSLIFIAIGFGILWSMLKSRIKMETAFMLLGFFILIDMWTVNRRYLNNDNFYEKAELEQGFYPTAADQFILTDPALDYRVLDLSKPSPFFNASASYFHKSVGGRHSARLQRYDELLTAQFGTSMNEHVLDMLNTKYLIVPGKQSPAPEVLKRPGALGNAWFVNQVSYVNNADLEMAAITEFSPRTTAIIHRDFARLVGKVSASDVASKIELTSYHPDHLVYKYKATKDELAVFAEIWYDKGWNAYLDGKKIPYFRANYVLRAAKLPAGNHDLEFKFEPVSYLAGDKISLICSILLIILASFTFYRSGRRDQAV
ncbi:MAG TPA: YfhO family protein [Pedobacter sp.]|nr:YfhO family protein [Pedobacter sp.]